MAKKTNLVRYRKEVKTAAKVLAKEAMEECEKDVVKAKFALMAAVAIIEKGKQK